jgi:predicted hydrocarbon binding protein
VGRRTYEKVGERGALLRTFDAGSVTVADCLTVVGWHERAIELCGGRDVKVTEAKCRARGAPHCEYRCEWV